MKVRWERIPVSLAVSILLAAGLAGCGKPATNKSAKLEQRMESPPPVSRELRLAADRFLYRAEHLRQERTDIGSALKQELIAGHYAALFADLEKLNQADISDPAYEFVYRDALSAIASCDSVDESIERSLIRLEDAKPSSVWTHMLFGVYYRAQMCHARGEGWARNVTDDQWMAVANFGKRARAEFEQAEAIDPRVFPIYDGLLTIATDNGSLNDITRIFETGHRYLPNSYLLAADYMNALEPRWFGTYRLMNRFANRMRGDVARNPRFYELGGSAAADRADALFRDGHYKKSLSEYERALQYGDYPTWLKWAGEAAVGERDYAAGYMFYRRYALYKPLDKDGLQRLQELKPYCDQLPNHLCQGDSGFPWHGETANFSSDAAQ